MLTAQTPAITPEQLGILGKPVCDKVTGFKGIATSVCFDLYGCVQVIVTPSVDDGKEGRWFDYHRLKVKSEKRVMPLPAYGQTNYAERGPAEKPDITQSWPKNVGEALEVLKRI